MGDGPWANYQPQGDTEGKPWENYGAPPPEVPKPSGRELVSQAANKFLTHMDTAVNTFYPVRMGKGIYDKITGAPGANEELRSMIPDAIRDFAISGGMEGEGPAPARPSVKAQPSAPPVEAPSPRPSARPMEAPGAFVGDQPATYAGRGYAPVQSPSMRQVLRADKLETQGIQDKVRNYAEGMDNQAIEETARERLAARMPRKAARADAIAESQKTAASPPAPDATQKPFLRKAQWLEERMRKNPGE